MSNQVAVGFQVEADVASRLVSVRLVGFATLADFETFKVAMDLAIDAVCGATRPYKVLYDVSAAAIQSQEVVQALRAYVVEAPKTAAIALVNASALAGRQLRRIFDDVDVRTCANDREALAWLVGVAH